MTGFDMAAQHHQEHLLFATDRRELLQSLIEAPHNSDAPRAGKAASVARLGRSADAESALALLRILLSTPLAPPEARLRLGNQALAEQRREAHFLLQSLLEAPAVPTDRRRPILLRPIEARRHLPRVGPRHNTVDQLLYYGASVLGFASVLVLGYWFVDGPVHDWLHYLQASPAQSVRVAHPITTDSQLDAARPDIALPFTKPQQRGLDPKDERFESTASVVPNRSAVIARDDQYSAPGDALRDTDSSVVENDFIAPRQAVFAPEPKGDLRPKHLLIPSIGLDTPVTEVFVVDDEWQIADYAAGYMHGTALPGGPGNVAISGHLGLRGGVFRDLQALAVGADVFVDTDTLRHHYRVREQKVIWPTQVEVLNPTDTAILTMLTCTNWDTQRLVVTADLVGTTALVDVQQ
jgi:sortase A